MPNSENKKKYNREYAKAHLKRIPLNLQISKYNEVKEHADKHSETVNGFIKRAIDETIQSDNKK